MVTRWPAVALPPVPVVSTRRSVEVTANGVGTVTVGLSFAPPVTVTWSMPILGTTVPGTGVEASGVHPVRQSEARQ